MKKKDSSSRIILYMIFIIASTFCLITETKYFMATLYLVCSSLGLFFEMRDIYKHHQKSKDNRLKSQIDNNNELELTHAAKAQKDIEH